MSKESIINFKNLRKTYTRNYDYALDILLKNQDKDRIKVNHIVFSTYSEILRKNGREEIDEENTRLPEFLKYFVKNMMTREKQKDQDFKDSLNKAAISLFQNLRDKKPDESQRQYEMRIKNLDKAKERKKSIQDKDIE